MHRLRVMMIGAALLALLVIPAAAQDSDDIAFTVAEGDFTLASPALVEQLDAFGQTVQVIEGRLTNESDDAYTNLTLFADLRSGETVIGEGVGFLTDACGLGLLPDFAFQPGASQQVTLTVELFDEGAVTDIDVFVQGVAVPPMDTGPIEPVVGITQVSDAEVVSVEWFDDESGGLRYATGCDDDVFLNQDWFRYDPATGESVAVLHPNTGDVTPVLLSVLGLEDPVMLNRSYLNFTPNDRRLIYQSRINDVLTAEPDGSFRRLIWDNLARHSLQGFTWLPGGRFMAYYFGAHGEDVRYFTASMAGQRISASIYDVQTSKIVPGPTPDGSRVVIAETFDGVTGYWLRGTFFNELTLLFEGDYPGNNYPAPLYVDRAESDIVYVVRPVDDVPLLQCYDTGTQQLNSLTALPLQIDTEHRAWTWLSPDGLTLALAANGINGGLWLVDLETFGVCGAPLAG